MVLKRRELAGFARVKKVNSASMGYPPSIFNKKCTLKWDWTELNWTVSHHQFSMKTLLSNGMPSCVPDVIGALAVWIQNQKKTSKVSVCLCAHRYLVCLINSRKGSARTTIQREHGPIMPEVCVHECIRMPRGLRTTRARRKRDSGHCADSLNTMMNLHGRNYIRQLCWHLTDARHSLFFSETNVWWDIRFQSVLGKYRASATTCLAAQFVGYTHMYMYIHVYVCKL